MEIREESQTPGHVPVNEDIQIFVVETGPIEQIPAMHQRNVQDVIEVQHQETVEVTADLDVLAEHLPVSVREHPAVGLV